MVERTALPIRKLILGRIISASHYDNITGDLQAMSDAIMASLYHVCGYHADCPKKSDMGQMFKSKSSLALGIRTAIHPISNDLIDPEKLKNVFMGKHKMEMNVLMA